jgi:hypothetical protein
MKIIFVSVGIGDWGLGIGPIPNPQSPNPFSFSQKKPKTNLYFLNINLLIYNLIIYNQHGIFIDREAFKTIILQKTNQQQIDLRRIISSSIFPFPFSNRCKIIHNKSNRMII